QARDEPGRLDPPERVDGAMNFVVGRRHARLDFTSMFWCVLCGSPSSWLLLLGNLFAHALFLLALLRCELGAEVLGLEDLADFDLRLFAARVRRALDPLDRLLLGLDLDDPEAGDQFLGLGERAVDDGALAAGEFDAFALGAG